MKIYGFILVGLSVCSLIYSILEHDYFYLILFIALYLFGALHDVGITTNVKIG